MIKHSHHQGTKTIDEVPVGNKCKHRLPENCFTD